MTQKTLLHVCCGPCSTQSLEELNKEHDLTIFWSNSNIWPEDEYKKRLDAARKVASIYSVPIVEDFYDHALWLAAIRGLEREPEGGMRCLKCFEYRLKKAAEYAKKNGFDIFTTSLTISPHKRTDAVFSAGRIASQNSKIPFLDKDFKQDDGFAKSIKLSKEYKIYRQNYCGCEFSMRRSMASPKE